MEIVIELLKVLLTWPFAAIFITIFLTISFKKTVQRWIETLAIKWEYGKATVTASSQNQNLVRSLLSDRETQPQNEQSEPQRIDVSQLDDVARSWRANAYIWEYRFLNHFLVLRTQMVLDWFYSLNKKVAYHYFDSYWLPHIPDPQERTSIISALVNHHLIEIDQNSLESQPVGITAKGREYAEFRGYPVPLPSSAVAESSKHTSSPSSKEKPLLDVK